MKKWSDFFGNWHNIYATAEQRKNFNAYDISASVVFYMLDTYGEKMLKEFFIDIGRTKDLNKSFNNIFGKPENDIESEWLIYLKLKKKGVLEM